VKAQNLISLSKSIIEMEESKERLLNETHKIFMDTGLNSPESLDLLDEIVGYDIMGLGTTIDERIFSISDLKNLIIRQREQIQGLKINWVSIPVFRKILTNENVAIYVDDITLVITMDNKKIEMSLRYSSVLEFQSGKWAVIHFHGSKPENVNTEEDTWGIEDWKKRNEELEKLVKERTIELETSLENLKATQALLIQSEKMASLGELTAGIAHEIQNPLNFVNNFSELSVDLAKELKEEADKAEIDKDLIIELATDLCQNQEKINHHGKRASSIVKGMLEHSRKSSGTKEPTDINALADEYLRLAYHGLRAKDKDFNAELITDYDPNLPKIDVIPQDMGRVFLNLITNAFYAVNEKAILLNLAKEQGDVNSKDSNYHPTVSMTTLLEANGQLVIAIKDNGDGIPDSIKDKIFQPFFTTKPTGRGTGLGLSLSYDIVKAHGGNISVESKKDTGTTFTITL
jgi:signal transduction histidine kinase